MLKRKQAPALYYGNVPEKQQHALQLIGNALDNLIYYVDCFEAAIKLYDQCTKEMRGKPKEKRLKFRSWQFIAARDGALTIFHFFNTLEALGNAVHECPYVKARLNASAIKEGKSKFRGQFPNFQRVRDSIGHAGEKSNRILQHVQHGFSGSYNRDGLAFGLNLLSATSSIRP